ncbi:MAG: tetratricopeptide repeat protein [Acidobacteria bacterium]|nr:tetratricopeptide repeat protein [Acidobacteriota bacterium]
MIPFVLGVLLAGAAASAAEPAQLDANLALFSVLAALNTAGFDADLASTSNHPLRPAVRKALAAKDIPSLAELKRYIRDHRQETDTGTLSLYISFALCVDAPGFKYRMRINDLPPEVAALEGLPDLMKRFHQQAGIDALWKQAQPAIEQALGRYQEPASRAALEANGYLRNPTSGSPGRRFQIYLDLLGPPNQVHTRSYGDEFFVVITPSPEPMRNDIRHAYLQYLLAPMVLRHREIIEKKKALGDFAQPAPLLPEIYKQDFLLLTEKSLVKAIEARLGAVSGRKSVAEQALAEGYILTPYFEEALAAYEKQEQAMRFYFPDLIQGIDLKKEDKRLEKVQFASAPLVRKARPGPQTPPPPEPSGVLKTIEEAEKLFESQQHAEARKLFLAALLETGDKALHGKAYYGLARIAIRENDPELGERLFQKALDLGPEPAVRAWCLVYLGRLADIAGEAKQAAAHYQTALAVPEASPKARETAEKGLKGDFRRKPQ